MDRLSDQQTDNSRRTSSDQRIAKKGYPGLVLVPPSDRTILRRRLVRGALLLVAAIWVVSTFTRHAPPSDPTACQSAAGQPGTEDSSENCDKPPSSIQTDTHRSEFSLTPLSQAEGLAESPNLLSSPKPDIDAPPPQPIVEHSPPPKSSSAGPAEHHSDQSMGNPGHEKSTSSRLSDKPVSGHDLDTLLAAQGDAFAQYRLGRYYAHQEGRQAPEAVSWYKKASVGLHRLAEAGNAQAMYVLGVMYAYGRGVVRDPEQARRWLTQAVEHKITAAQPVLAALQVHPNADPKRR